MSLRPLIYGDAPLDQWSPPESEQEPNEPWASFQRARQFAGSGQSAQAAAIWRQIAQTEGLESRVTLQAWHFLRQVGQSPPDEQAGLLLGAVAEVPMAGTHDVLAAYRDGTARYLNHAGGAVIWEGGEPAIQAVIDDWLALAQGLANVIGVWDQPALPPLPPGHMRVLMLTPSGPRFGQGPEAALAADPAASQFLVPATRLLQMLVSRST